MNDRIAVLSEEEKNRIKELDEELGIILIAYFKDHVSEHSTLQQHTLTQQLRQEEYLDDPNLNLL